MLRRVALVRTDVSEELSASFIRVTRICELGTTLAVTSNRPTLRINIIYYYYYLLLIVVVVYNISSQCGSVASYSSWCSQFTDSSHPDEGGAKFLRNASSYNSHTA
jgi:hypothetical protein